MWSPGEDASAAPWPAAARVKYAPPPRPTVCYVLPRRRGALLTCGRLSGADSNPRGIADAWAGAGGGVPGHLRAAAPAAGPAALHVGQPTRRPRQGLQLLPQKCLGAHLIHAHVRRSMLVVICSKNLFAYSSLRMAAEVVWCLACGSCWRLVIPEDSFIYPYQHIYTKNQTGSVLRELYYKNSWKNCKAAFLFIFLTPVV